MSSSLYLYRPCSNILCGVVSDHQDQLDEVFTTESSEIFASQYSPMKIIDHQNVIPFASKHADGWVTVGFKNHFLFISHYSISQRYDGHETSYIKGWFIEGSLDNNTWTILDHKKDMASIASQGHNSTYETRRGVYRYFRLRSNQEYIIVVGRIDFYGVICQSLEECSLFNNSTQVCSFFASLQTCFKLFISFFTSLYFIS